MTEPLVCVPTASGTMPAPTAAAEPEDEPPGVRVVSCGLRVLPGVKTASSVVTALPRMMAPAARSFSTTAASCCGRRPWSKAVPFSVGKSRVSTMSFSPTGTPCSGPIGRPVPRCLSAASACRMAWSGSRCAKACTSGSRSAMRARHASVSSTALTAPRAISSRAVQRGHVRQAHLLRRHRHRP